MDENPIVSMMPGADDCAVRFPVAGGGTWTPPGKLRAELIERYGRDFVKDALRRILADIKDEPKTELGMPRVIRERMKKARLRWYAERANDLLDECADADDAGCHDEAVRLHNAAYAVITAAQKDGFSFTNVIAALGQLVTTDDPRTENYEVRHCAHCLQMTNHLDGVCQKCKQPKEQS